MWLIIMTATLIAMLVNVVATEPRIIDDPAWQAAISSKCGPEKA